MKTLLALLLISALSIFLSGCETADPEEDTLPWSTPQRWEQNKMPMVMPDYAD